jgi:Kef-type K+ transport system membrane component KefB
MGTSVAWSGLLCAQAAIALQRPLVTKRWPAGLTGVAEIGFDNLAIVVAVAFAAPLLLGIAPALRVPSVVLEIATGIVLGPSVLGWVHIDAAVQVLALIGVGFLLLLAGIEIDYHELRGRQLELALAAFALSFGIALALSFGLDAAGVLPAPFLTAVILSATSLAVVLPVLKDSQLIESRFGQLVIAATSIADVATVVMLSLFFSGKSGGAGTKVLLFGGFAGLCVAAAAAIVFGGRVGRVSNALLRLQDTTAQIRVRGAFLLLVLFAIVADRFGLEAILGTFLAGAVLKLADRDGMMTHSHFHRKLDEAGFGFFIPVFFVSSGIRFDGHALFASGSALAKVPLFFVLLLAIRGLPAVIFRPLVGGRLSAAAGLLLATNLSFVIVASQIGRELGLLTSATAAALVAAAVLSVLVYPLLALGLLRRPAPARGNERWQPDTVGA